MSILPRLLLLAGMTTGILASMSMGLRYATALVTQRAAVEEPQAARVTGVDSEGGLSRLPADGPPRVLMEAAMTPLAGGGLPVEVADAPLPRLSPANEPYPSEPARIALPNNPLRIPLR